MPELRDDLNSEIPDLILRTAVPGRHSARGALRHLERAAALVGIDNEMAAFRALTAEEEAATALMHSLRRNGYRGSDRLRPWKHVHKRAFIPFMDGINNVFARAQAAGTIKVELLLERNDRETPVKVQIWHPTIPIGQRARPVPPLGFSLRIDDGPAPYFAEVQRFADGCGAQSTMDYLRQLANQRNQLLYANHEGVPSVTDLGNLLPTQAKKVNRLLLAYIMVDQVRTPQLFVQECLDAFLALLGRVECGASGA